MTKTQRLASLDVLRGLTVIGMITVNATAGVFYGNSYQVYPLLLHAPWQGLNLADLVFPGFLFMVGVAVPFAMSKAQAPTASTIGHIGARSLRLVLIGLLVSNLYWLADLDQVIFRPWGVLQRIGIVYGICSLIYLYAGWRAMAALAGGILLIYWPLSLLPALDGLPNDIWQKGHNFVASVDRVMLGEHNYVKGKEGYDPEGLLGTLPAVGHGLIGVLAGLFLKAGGTKTGLKLIGAGLLLTIVGAGWGLVFPVIKDIWSSTFVLVTCGITMTALGLLHMVVDNKDKPPFWTVVPMAFGINAIAAYVLHEFSAQILSGAIFRRSYQVSVAHIGPQAASLVPVFIYVAMIWVVMDYLRRKGWIIKV
jgi:predicted acyltransferase